MGKTAWIAETSKFSVLAVASLRRGIPVVVDRDPLRRHRQTLQFTTPVLDTLVAVLYSDSDHPVAAAKPYQIDPVGIDVYDLILFLYVSRIRALEEEHAALAAIYLDLEERSAAATAADEAMAMILRLQEEESIEMEARQYQRIIEEKSAYDAEEMNILKEILVRRQREKHVLEKEVEVYREMIGIGNPHIHDDIQDMVKREQLATLLDLSEDPVLILQQLNESIDKKQMVCTKQGIWVYLMGFNQNTMKKNWRGLEDLIL
ncbi:hypothetical protein U1Q18_033805 [Sarracenia purpurea var. burkii]